MKLLRYSLPILCTLLVPTLSTIANAEDPDDGSAVTAAEDAETESAEDTPKIHLHAEPASLGNSRTYHRHDGFYVRTNFGLSCLWANLGDDSDFNVDASGTGMALDLLIGGSPSPGIAIGGGVIGNWSFSAEFEQEGETVPDRDIQDFTIGAFVDGFPRDTGPWHLGALVGFSSVMVNQDFVDNTVGLGGAIWTGYDAWVADDWALGGELRFTINRTSGESSGVDFTANTATLGLLFSALYH